MGVRTMTECLAKRILDVLPTDRYVTITEIRDLLGEDSHNRNINSHIYTKLQKELRWDTVETMLISANGKGGKGNKVSVWRRTGTRSEDDV